MEKLKAAIAESKKVMEAGINGMDHGELATLKRLWNGNGTANLVSGVLTILKMNLSVQGKEDVQAVYEHDIAVLEQALKTINSYKPKK